MSRPGNNPKRRIAATDKVTGSVKRKIVQSVRYMGSGHHKRNPADYGLPRTNPRPTKSLCDQTRVILLGEARALVETGIELGLFSDIREDGFPKFIWSVSDAGEVFEAKTDANGTGDYHGYPLEAEDAMHGYIKSIWKEKCQKPGR